MSKLSDSRKGSSVSAVPPHHHSPSPLSGEDTLYLSSADWFADLKLGSPYAQGSVPPSLAPASPQPPMSQLTPLTPLSQSSQLHMFPDMPVPTFEHGNYLTVNAQLPWSSDSLMVPPLYHDMSSQGSSPSARLSSETPSFQDADTPAAEQQQPPKKPKRSRPNRYKNAPPAVIQRRRAANRKSQRAYRKRKDDRIAELEELLRQAAERERDMSRAYATLRTEYEQQLLMGGGGSSSSGSGSRSRHHGRPPSAAAAASEEEDAAGVTIAPTFLAMAAFSQQQNGDGSLIAPQLLDPQQPQQLTPSPHLLPIYPPAPMRHTRA
ncbi:hypothetical protein ISF_06901 [Cordyceps fumosorosea ARSEF 2679]|uniref:BZIP domain-containing protein n=1 Tax=Cordyceps fumosorosea (strain ARSEF 2679) TaxID=1081104 RepID=A0A167QI00_CORFA|nr:hypothetical protein ISF_06901 [Cordyceps fumosorosea ARSEF 2679]OAA57660.1 hypothetical protein ISF_06901 [Cordyceps fumosorosea ARSEF 2679]